MFKRVEFQWISQIEIMAESRGIQAKDGIWQRTVGWSECCKEVQKVPNAPPLQDQY